MIKSHPFLIALRSLTRNGVKGLHPRGEGASGVLDPRGPLPCLTQGLSSLDPGSNSCEACG